MKPRPGELAAPAYAKINLSLEILGKRTDGLHEVRSVLQTVGLADEIRVAPDDDLTLSCEGMTVEPENLILRAARLLLEATASRAGARIECVKRIPIGGGLGGGSADAAVTLRLLNQLWRCHLSDAELRTLAGKLGADVPFLVSGGTALVSGTGREIRALADAPPFWLVLAPLSSPDGEKTREMYASLGPEDHTDGSSTSTLVAAMVQGTVDYDRVRSAFDRVACARWEVTREAVAALRGTPARAVAVSGAGPSVFALYETEVAASQAYDLLNGRDRGWLVLPFVPAAEAAFARN